MPPPSDKPTSFAGLRPMSEDFSIEPPEVHIDDTEEKKKKTLSKTKEWKKWREFALQRREQYRQFLPGVNPAVTKSDDNWRIADCIIREIDNLIAFTEGGDGKSLTD